MSEAMKVMFEYKDGKEFGTEIDGVDAILITSEFVSGEEKTEAGDYTIDLTQVISIKFFR